eukprot:jgi/Mesvir1/15604/Mv03213-RA.1
MGRLELCFNRSCTARGTKACAKCHAAYYCSRECQVADHPDHKVNCGKSKAAGGTAPSPSSTWTGGNLRSLVVAAAQELDGRFATTGGDVPVHASSQLYDETPAAFHALTGSAFHALVESCREPSCDHERELGSAGAPAVLADALDRSLSGRCWIPLTPILAAVAGLMRTSSKNRAAFGRLGAISTLTAALNGATQRRAWEMAREINNACFSTLALEDGHCGYFGAAGTLNAIRACIVAGVADPDGGIKASVAGCSALSRVHTAETVCKDKLCPHLAHTDKIHAPPLLAAFDVCLDDVVTPGGGHDPGFVIDLGEGALLAVNTLNLCAILAVVNAIWVVLGAAQARQGADIRDAIATDRVCRNLVRACEAAWPRHMVGDTGRMSEIQRALALTMGRTVTEFARDERSCHLAAKLRGACPHVVQWLRIANREASVKLQQEASTAIRALATDPSGSKSLFDEGVVKDAADMLSAAMERRQVEMCIFANGVFSGLSAIRGGARRLGMMAKDVAPLLVQSLEFMLASADRPTLGGWSFVQHMSSLVECWGKMVAAHPACRQQLLAAGAGEAVARAMGAAREEQELEVLRCLRQAKETFLSSKAVVSR